MDGWMPPLLLIKHFHSKHRDKFTFTVSVVYRELRLEMRKEENVFKTLPRYMNRTKLQCQ